MPRKRASPDDAWLAGTRVYRAPSGSYAYHPPEGGSITIARKSATRAEVFAALEAAKTAVRINSLDFLATKYFQSENFTRLSAATRNDYQKFAIKLPMEYFGPTDCTKLRPHHIQVYMDLRGDTSKVRANRELALLSSIFAFAYARGLMPANPCEGVQKFKESRRKHYAEDADYKVVFDAAPPVVQVAMEIAYCTGWRQADVLALQWSQIKKDGIHYTESKTGKEAVKLLSARLQRALDQAKTLHGVAGIGCVVRNRSGRRYTRDGFNTIWSRAMAVLPKERRFTFHDMRRKAVTDYEGRKADFSLHSSDRMAESYSVKPQTSPSLD
jgi:integrase